MSTALESMWTCGLHGQSSQTKLRKTAPQPEHMAGGRSHVEEEPGWETVPTTPPWLAELQAERLQAHDSLGPRSLSRTQTRHHVDGWNVLSINQPQKTGGRARAAEGSPVEGLCAPGSSG